MRSHASSGVSSPIPVAIPALAQNTSTGPNASRARSSSAPTCASSATSQATPSAPSPISAATVSAPAPSRSAATTPRAPSRAKRRTSARPIPEAPPVTTATRPESSTVDLVDAERRAHDPALLGPVSSRVALARRGPELPPDVLVHHPVGQDPAEPRLHRRARAHVLRLLLRPHDRL